MRIKTDKRDENRMAERKVNSRLWKRQRYTKRPLSSRRAIEGLGGLLLQRTKREKNRTRKSVGKHVGRVSRAKGRRLRKGDRLAEKSKKETKKKRNGAERSRRGGTADCVRPGTKDCGKQADKSQWRNPTSARKKILDAQMRRCGEEVENQPGELVMARQMGQEKNTKTAVKDDLKRSV